CLALAWHPGRALAARACCPPVEVTRASFDLGINDSVNGHCPCDSWLGVDGIGGVYAWWIPESLEPELYRSWDDGDTWQPPINPAGRRSDMDTFEVAVDVDGTMLATYRERGDAFVRVSHDQGRTFGAVQSI